MEYGNDTAMLLYTPCYVAIVRLFFKRVRRANAVLTNLHGSSTSFETGHRLASPQTSVGVRLSRVTNEPQRTSAGRLAIDCIMYSCGLQLTKTKNDHDNTK